MSVYLSGKVEIETNVENMINELRRYLQIFTGQRIDKIDAVAFALFYTITNIKHDEIKHINLDDVNLVSNAIRKFKDRLTPLIPEIIDKALTED